MDTGYESSLSETPAGSQGEGFSQSQESGVACHPPGADAPQHAATLGLPTLPDKSDARHTQLESVPSKAGARATENMDTLLRSAEASEISAVRPKGPGLSSGTAAIFNASTKSTPAEDDAFRSLKDATVPQSIEAASALGSLPLQFSQSRLITDPAISRSSTDSTVPPEEEDPIWAIAAKAIDSEGAPLQPTLNSLREEPAPGLQPSPNSGEEPSLGLQPSPNSLGEAPAPGLQPSPNSLGEEPAPGLQLGPNSLGEEPALGLQPTLNTLGEQPVIPAVRPRSSSPAPDGKYKRRKVLSGTPSSRHTGEGEGEGRQLRPRATATRLPPTISAKKGNRASGKKLQVITETQAAVNARGSNQQGPSTRSKAAGSSGGAQRRGRGK